VYVCPFQLLNQLAGFPQTSCKIIALVDRLNFLISSSQQSNMTAERSGEAELTLLGLLYGPELQQMLDVCAAFVKEVFLDDTWGPRGIVLVPSLWSRQLISHRKQTTKIGTQIINTHTHTL
jgi:hypothetical protein